MMDVLFKKGDPGCRGKISGAHTPTFSSLLASDSIPALSGTLAKVARKTTAQIRLAAGASTALELLAPKRTEYSVLRTSYVMDLMIAEPSLRSSVRSAPYLHSKTFGVLGVSGHPPRVSEATSTIQIG